MGKTIERAEIILSVVKGMWANINKHVRCVSVDWTDDFFHIRAYFDKEPNEDECEDIQCITTEVLADFSEFVKVKEECLFSDAPWQELKTLSEIIYLRND